MRAAVHTRYGPPEVVNVVDVPMPHVGDGDVLVEVHATSVNRTDCGFRAASPFIARLFTGLRQPKQTILGNEFAGEVVDVGRNVTSLTIGDRVFGYNEGPFGCHAEYLSIPEHASIAKTPGGTTFEIAAVSTEGAHYALSFIRAAKIRRGQTVLVNGATGGIGSAAVQILDHLGADVTAVCAGEHAEMVADLGANRVIDYTAQDFTAEEMTYDVVLDTVGKSTFARSRRILKPRGIYLSSELGRWAQNPVLALVTPMLRTQRVMFPIPKHDQQIVTYIGDLMHSGAFVPVIDRVYPLEDIVEAYRYVESGQKIGNVLITVV